MTVEVLERPRGILPRPIDYPRIPPDQISPKVALLEQYSHEVALPKGDLRRGQREALVETVDAFKNGERAVAVEQVSGYGKSRLAEVVRKGFGPKARVVYITPGDTASTNIVNKSPGEDVGRVDKDNKEFFRKITVIAMPSLQRLKSAIQRGDEEWLEEAAHIFSADLVIADEMHHYLTPPALEALSTFLYLNPRSHMLGVTATSKYNEEKSAEKQFGRIIHKVDLVEGVEEGVLISPHVRYVKTGISLDNSRITPGGDYVLEGSIPVREWDRKLLEAYLKTCEEEGRMLRTISYTSNIEHAKSYAALAESMGIPTAIVTKDTRSKERERIYERLHQGEILTVATVSTAVESLDLPWLDGTLHSAQTRSWRVANQMFPRSMRNEEGKKNPWIIQAVAENTSYKNRSILASDILGERHFVNGSILAPKKIKEPEKRSVDIVPVERPSYELPEGVEVAVEIIDINSLFNMSMMDKIGLLSKGLMSDEDVDKVRELIRKQVAGGDNVFTASVTNMQNTIIADGNDMVSLARIASEMYGVKIQDLTPEHAKRMIDFLNEGQEKKIWSYETRKNDNYIDPKLLEAASRLRFKEGATLEERRFIANFTRQVLEAAEGQLHMSNADFLLRRIDHDLFRGTFASLMNRCGFNIDPKTGYQALNIAATERLLTFTNIYSEGKRLSRYSWPSKIDEANIDDYMTKNEFANLCSGYKIDIISEDEKLELAKRVRDVLSVLDPVFFGSAERLSVARIKHPSFEGSPSVLSGSLGFNERGIYFEDWSYQQLIDFANSGGLTGTEPWIEQDKKEEIGGKLGEMKLSERRKFVGDVLKQAKNSGYNILSTSVMSDYNVDDARFTGSLSDLARTLRMGDGSSPEKTLRRLLAYGGMWV